MVGGKEFRTDEVLSAALRCWQSISVPLRGTISRPPHPARETLHAERGALSTSTESTERRGLCSGPLAGWHSGGGVGGGWGAGEPEAHTRSGM